MSELKERFGHLLAAHRKQVGYTQFQLAARASVSVDMVAKLETAASAPRFGTIEKLAAALQIDPAQFFTDQIGGRPFQRRALTDLVAALAVMSDAELRWVAGIIKAAQAPKS